MKNSKKIYSLTEYIGKPVRIYRNLHKKCWSVLFKGKVVGHAKFLALTNVTFLVLPGGYERFKKTNVKNVHAFLCGTLYRFNSQTANDSEAGKGRYVGVPHKVSYDPRRGNSFYKVETGKQIPFGAWFLHATCDKAIFAYS